MTPPLVSVIVAVHNGERFLRAALQSLYAQDYDPFEVIFIDDGSVDSSGDIAQEFAGIRYVYQENKGLAAARNAGLELARGEFLAYLDDDDIIPSHKLRRQVGYLVDNPGVGCVLGRQEIMLEAGVEPPDWLTRDTIFGDLDGIPFVSAMIRTSVLREVGGFDASYRFAEDRDLFVRLREHGVRIEVIPEVLLFRRFHGENMNFRLRPEKHPLLRSLKAKIDRERAVMTEGGPAS
ncbi:MAG TPA: glycosyltransferase family A protein [Propionibacteriaceae bacterium]|nr:glycosyltransferase family A protein [Propionibacteriaceae bacterium]